MENQQQLTPATAAKPRVRLVYFDIISIIACIFVCIVHFNASTCGYDGTFLIPENSIVPNHLFGGRVYLGSLGVSMFFILSGARLMYNYKGVKNFFVKRVLNLYPMFWIAFCVATIVSVLWNRGYSSGNPLLLIASVFGLDGYLGSMGYIPMNYYMVGEWFLGCILLMYLFFPLIHAGVEKCPGFTMLVAATIYILFVHRCPEQSFFLRFPELILGMLFIKYDGEKRIWWLTGFSAAFLAVTLILRNYVAQLTMCIATAMLLFCLCTIFGKLIRGEKLKKALAFGSALTYPIFLVHHQIIAKAAYALNISSQPQPKWEIVLLFVAYLAVTIPMAWLLSVAGGKLQKHLTSFGGKREKK